MESAVMTRNLTKVFGSFTAVDGLTLDIRPGEICGFLGPNGAGKTTAVRMLCGILEPTSGEASILGYDLLTETERIKSNIGYMSQKFSLYYDLSVKENLVFYAGMYRIPSGEKKKRVAEMISMAGLTGRENELVASLPSGFRQRLALGCAIISRPSIVFLDEPTSGVSPNARRSFFNIIQNLANEGTTVIVTTHFMDEAERCGKIAFISGGRLMALDSPDKLKNSTLEGHLVELHIPNAIDRISEVEKLPFVKECSIHGPVLHVLLEDENMKRALDEIMGANARPITPSLEDVFIALAHKQRKRTALDT